ncbi:MAG: hypothetical protein ACLU48_02005 [Clostridiaceae bacterium]
MACAVHPGTYGTELGILRRVLSVVRCRIVMEMGQFDTQVLKAVEEEDLFRKERITSRERYGIIPYGRQSLPVMLHLPVLRAVTMN